MLNFKSLSTGVAAASLVSVIGLAYAQTTTPPTSSETTEARMQPDATVTPNNTMTPRSMSPSTGANDVITEPAPRTDRN